MSHVHQSQNALSSGEDWFTSTDWGVALALGHGESSAALRALEKLCQSTPGERPWSEPFRLKPERAPRTIARLPLVWGVMKGFCSQKFLERSPAPYRTNYRRPVALNDRGYGPD